MKLVKQILVGSVFTLVLHCGHVFAQPQPGGGGPGGWANMDPQQMQQRIQQMMMDNLREQLAVTNDAEWGVIEQRLSKVTQLRTETMITSAMGMFGGMRRGGGRGGFGGLAGLSKPDPNVDALQNSVDNNAPAEQIKTALAKLRDSRKQKQAELVKAQADLRSVLTTKQEAVLVLAGMLD